MAARPSCTSPLPNTLLHLLSCVVSFFAQIGVWLVDGFAREWPDPFVNGQICTRETRSAWLPTDSAGATRLFGGRTGDNASALTLYGTVADHCSPCLLPVTMSRTNGGFFLRSLTSDMSKPHGACSSICALQGPMRTVASMENTNV